MYLLLMHPETAKINCQFCLVYQVDIKTGCVAFGRDKRPAERYINCGKEFLAPCRNDKGCPKGSPEKPKTLSEENKLCYEHYCECKAVGWFPKDSVVRRNAAIIREVEEQVAREKAEAVKNENGEILTLLASMKSN